MRLETAPVPALGWRLLRNPAWPLRDRLSEAGVCASLLPEANPARLVARLRARFPTAREQNAVPLAVQQAMQRLQALIAGDSRDQLLDVQLDETGQTDFNRRVYALTRQIPVGKSRSYGELAAQLGQPGAARAVGMAQGQNPFAPIVPCHRVLGSDGALTGFSASGGLQTKRQLLLIEARVCGQLAGEQGALF